MRIFVTGAAGQLGQELVKAFEGHDVVATTRADLDITDRSSVLSAVTTTQPDTIIHSAAWTAVDACEGDPDRAFNVNALGTRNVVDAANRVGARLCHVSTDYVFSGDQDEPYTEWDAPAPRSVYGRSKLAGEHEALRSTNATIVRIAWVCGRHGSNMVKTILRLASSGEPLRFVDDQRGRPTFAEDAALAIRRLVIEQWVGTFHVTNQGAVTWFEFAQAVLDAAGDSPERVSPIRTEDLDPPRPAPRPTNSVLDDCALRLSGLPRLPHFRESLDRLVHELQRAP